METEKKAKGPTGTMIKFYDKKKLNGWDGAM